MGLSPVRLLIDKSALARLALPAISAAIWQPMVAGEVGVSIMTELEMGFSARSYGDYIMTREQLVDRLLPVALPWRAEARARDVQRSLVERAQHRAVSVPDLLIAATAEIEGLTVLHYDADFDMIAEVTGQPTQWVVPRGSI